MGADALTAASAAQNEAQNNRLLHADEYQLLRDKARDIARQSLGSEGSASSLKAAEAYWYDLLVSEALATVDAQSRGERIAYLQEIAATGQPAKTITEGYFNAAGYLQDAQLARETVRSLAGSAILGSSGQSIIADGQALTTFQASPDQFRDHQLFSPTATVADRVRQFGDPLAAINASYGASQKANDSALLFITHDDQARLERFNTPNGQAAPNTIDLDIALGLAAPISALRQSVGEWGAARVGSGAAADATDAVRIANNFYRDGGVPGQPYPKSLSEPISTSSDIIFGVNPDKTTTVLGSFGRDMESVIGQQLGYPKTIDFGARPGAFNVLNVPDELYARLAPDQFWEIYNKPFLDAARSRRDRLNRDCAIQ